jgi:predicted aspartyl protease
MRAPTLFALALLSLTACELTPAPRIETPEGLEEDEISFELVGPDGVALVVPVKINGVGPFDFVLDTGATLTCIDEQLAELLALEDAPGRTMGAVVGGIGTMRLVRLESVRLGETTAHGLKGCVLDLQHLRQLPGVEVHGLLGLDFLKSFRVTLDFGRMVARLEEL